jgi:aryl-phospho-beta-D-glucosidase BglC (GH1 family)
MVLEPWITPSLFYPWVGNTRSEGFAHDTYTYCEELGPIEGNKRLRAHWDAWLTEEHIAELARM